jgi:transposase
LEREICDWNRFSNRRVVGSFVGLTPGEASSGPHRQLGSITKCGNARVRWLAIQAAWRLVRFQPNYLRVRRFNQRCITFKASARRRRQFIVALAREFLIDWWRIRTARTTADKLGLELQPAKNC